MTQRSIQLTEWAPSPSHELNLDEVKALQGAAPDLVFTPEGRNRYTLRSASNRVGIVESEGVTLRIEPSKCSAGLVVFMLSYAHGAKHLKDDLASFDTSTDVWESMVQALNHQLRRALRHGVHRGYRYEEDALPTIRGRVRIEDQLRRRFRLTPPIEVAFDEYTEDIAENRVLRAALERCHQLPLRSAPLRTELRHHEGQLSNVENLQLDPWRPPQISWNRLNEHLRPAVELGLLILKNTSVSLGEGHHRSPGFLVDMATVFEDFVVAGLRDRLGLDDRSFPQGVKGKLRLAEHIDLKPDFSQWRGEHCVGVGDVKYKRTTADGVLHPDLYQVFAYAVAAQLPEATLVYAKSKAGAVGDEATRVHDVNFADKRLRVEVLDLDQGPAKALDELDRIANVVRPSVDAAQAS